MRLSSTKILFRSLSFYKKSSVYQIVIVLILAAIITGSLLTGFSVRQSLRATANEHLGNTDVLISTGLRYFDSKLAEGLTKMTGEKSAAILETTGYCQNFATGITSLNTSIFGITPDFFTFNDVDSVSVDPGSVAINENLARQLDIRTGEEIIVNYREITPIPANAPFANTEDANKSKVFIVSHILSEDQSANFSLGISQISPLNIFINISDLTGDITRSTIRNRLLIKNSNDLSSAELSSLLQTTLKPDDIGLNLKKTESTGGFEIVSDRIFIDQEIIDIVTTQISGTEPVISYLANSISSNGNKTPYSFIAALPDQIYPNAPADNSITINRWLADDLNTRAGDTIELVWFAPDAVGELIETGNKMVVDKIVDSDSIWGDPTLMPEFPGIAGKSSCSDWDAGVPVEMSLIRDKDEEYWNNYQGTPKAFINYNTGRELWGSNFGPATALRFPASISGDDIINSLEGKLDPGKTGFTITDIREKAINAAGEGVDFSTLFLSLGIFIIVSCLILLALSVGIFFDSRKDHVKTYYALGFTNKWIENLLFLETLVISITGAIPGVLAGGMINILIIAALNSVWSGAVQTDTMEAYISVLPLLTGLIVTLLICFILLKVKTRRFLKALGRSEKETVSKHSLKRNFISIVAAFLVTIGLIVISSADIKNQTSLLFGAGITTFIFIVLVIRHYYIGGFNNKKLLLSDKDDLSKRYNSNSPSHALTPVIIVAAGIFAVFVTGVNRLEINDKMKEPSGGTGGYLLWAETAIPVKSNLNSEDGKREYGLNEEGLRDMFFIQAKQTSGDDASCLNLNHITAPPLLGIDPEYFIENGSFSFASSIESDESINPWSYLTTNKSENTIYGIADQTVLQWGLMISPGDTIILKSESGEPLNIIIAAGLESSVFQGYVLIGSDNLNKFFPSVPGNTIMLVGGSSDNTANYRTVLEERFSNLGISVLPAFERLASFFEVTNTYLSVFTILGAFGMLLGIAGLGFVLVRNYNHRKREYALMIATGFSLKVLKKIIYREQLFILTSGIVIGIISAIISTWPSVSGGSEIPWTFLGVMSVSVLLAGLGALAAAVITIEDNALIRSLRKE